MQGIIGLFLIGIPVLLAWIALVRWLLRKIRK